MGKQRLGRPPVPPNATKYGQKVRRGYQVQNQNRQIGLEQCQIFKNELKILVLVDQVGSKLIYIDKNECQTQFQMI